MPTTYIYELHRGDEIAATGHFTSEGAVEIGDRVDILGRLGIVQSIVPIRSQTEDRLVVQLLAPDED